jgi:hypothetical protein
MKKVKKKVNKKPPLKKELVVYIYNIVEDEWLFLSSVQPRSKRYEMMSDCNVYAECYLFTNSQESEFVYVSPLDIPNNFVKYFQSVTANKKIDVMVPKMRTGLICKDLYIDKELFRSLVKTAKKYEKIKLVSYASSREFLELKEKLIELGINVITPEAPELENAWTVNFFGSKSGIRQLNQKFRTVEPEFIMPEGVTCFGKIDAAKIAANRYINKKGVVLKTNKGSGGDGLIIFHEGELPLDFKACEKRIIESLNKDEYWDRSPIIIEELIKVNFKSSDSFPNIEFKIHNNGKIEMLYYCTMIVTKEGKYSGLDMNKDVLSKKTAAKIIKMGNYIAQQYALSGYRGHFDIDMISDVNKRIYVCESNTRNTGGTDVYKFVRSIYGDDFLSDVYVINRDNFKFVDRKKVTFEEVLKVLKPILVDHNKKEGVVLSASKSLEFNQLSYTVLGKNKKTAYNLQKEFFRLMEFFN